MSCVAFGPEPLHSALRVSPQIAMRRALTAVLILAILYVAGFTLLRWRLHSTNTVFLQTATGYSPPVEQQRTFLWIPGTGVERPLKQAVYWLFYPAGSVDRLITGRVYDRTDARNILL
jgi:hypothetical protein